MKVRLLQAGSVLGALLFWDTLARAGLLNPLFVPAPEAVAAAVPTVLGPALPALGATLAKTLAAYALSVGLGLVLGLVIGSARYLHDEIGRAHV